MISGGAGVKKSVEAYRSDWTPLCSLPDLPDDRYWHTMNGDLSCGGGGTGGALNSCIHYGVGGWSKYSWNLQQQRYGAVSWRLPNGKGVQIMGGWSYGSEKTSEIVTSTGSQKGFGLEYETT